MAQEVIAKKCGIVDEAHHLDTMTLQQYINLYKQPMTESSMKAIEKLSEITTKKKIDKLKGKKVKKVKKLTRTTAKEMGNETRTSTMGAQ